MSKSPENTPPEESQGVTRDRLQRVLTTEPYNALDFGDDQPARSVVEIEPIVHGLGMAVGRMTFIFTEDGGLEMTLSTYHPDTETE